MLPFFISVLGCLGFIGFVACIIHSKHLLGGLSLLVAIFCSLVSLADTKVITETHQIYPTIAFSEKEVFIRYKSNPPTIVALDSFYDVTNFQKYSQDSIKFELITTKNGFGKVIDEKLKIEYPEQE